MHPFQVDRIASLDLQVPDLDAAAAFYVEGLGFAPDGAADGRRRLRLGAQTVKLAGGGEVRRDAANATAFQHFALVVSDMGRAHAHVMRLDPEAVSRGGPQRLPASSGGVTAWKFRGPGGQPLELLEAPTDVWRAEADRTPGALFLGVDHTALGCADLPASLAFYERLGFRRGPGSRNRGPEQDRLDGLAHVDLQIATLFAPGPGPHIELLRYVHPPAPAGGAPGGIAMIVEGRGAAGGLTLTDPDGHRIGSEPKADTPASPPRAADGGA